MAQNTNRQKFLFVGKSLLWSTLLYTLAIIAMDWNDIKHQFTGRKAETIVRIDNTDQNPSYTISVDTLGKQIRTIPKSLLNQAFNRVIDVFIR